MKPNLDSMLAQCSDIIKKHDNIPITDPFELSQLIEKAYLRGYITALYDFGKRSKNGELEINGNSIDPIIQEFKKFNMLEE